MHHFTPTSQLHRPEHFARTCSGPRTICLIGDEGISSKSGWAVKSSGERREVRAGSGPGDPGRQFPLKKCVLYCPGTKQSGPYDL